MYSYSKQTTKKQTTVAIYITGKQTQRQRAKLSNGSMCFIFMYCTECNGQNQFNFKKGRTDSVSQTHTFPQIVVVFAQNALLVVSGHTRPFARVEKAKSFPQTSFQIFCCCCRCSCC